MRVNEIFYSLQGEGLFSGTPAVFLRLSGCNLKCPFCDTQHEQYTEMSEQEITKQVSKYPTRHIVITGGEPSLQLNDELIHRLHRQGFYIQIETNGTRPLPEEEPVDWVTCSPKDGGRLRIQVINELKVVYQGQDMQQYDHIKAEQYYLQPLDSGDKQKNEEITKQTINYILNHPKWTLSLQTHKILNMR